MDLHLYKLIPPRPMFLADMTADEGAVMEEHFAYWRGLLERGDALVYGPVADPAGAYGIAILAAHIDDPTSIGTADPAVVHGIATFEVHPMPNAVAPTPPAP